MERVYHCDVAVVGGGIAGVSAAVGAAQAGARVLLLERNPYFGGEATHAGVGAFCGLYTAGAATTRAVAGVADQLLAEMAALGDPLAPTVAPSGNRVLLFRQEYCKCALDNLLQKSDAQYLLHTRVVQADTENAQVKQLICADDESLFTVKAAAFVDASGDANLVHIAGGETLWGNEKGQVQVAVLPFRLSGVSPAADISPTALEKAVLAAKAAGIPHLTLEKGFIQRVGNSQNVTVLLPSAVPENMTGEAQTALEQELRRQTLGYVTALRRFLPGFEHCELTVIGPAAGYRETRHIRGRETLCEQDVLTLRRRQNSVARGGWRPELHKGVNEEGQFIALPDGSYFDIPLGALQPAGLENVLAAGRTISTDEIAYASIRVMGTGFATGQAAGVAAARFAKQADFDLAAIRAELVRQNALV